MNVSPHFRQVLWLSSLALLIPMIGTTAHVAMAEDKERLSAHGVAVELPAEWQENAKVEVVPAMPPLYSIQEQAFIAEYRKRKKDGKPVEKFPMGLLRKPGGTLPRHIRIRFENLPEFAFENGTHHVPEITVQRIEDYQFIESADGEAEPRIFPELSKLLFEGNSGTPLQHMPLITLTSTGGHYFSKRIAFGSGKGARVVTRYQVEADILREGVLAYFYQGITADKMHFVFATFPIKMRGLAVDSHLGYSTKTREEYRRVLHSQDDYNRKAEIWMGENRDTIQPNLELLDRIMESVSVTEPELDLKE